MQNLSNHEKSAAAGLLAFGLALAAIIAAAVIPGPASRICALSAAAAIVGGIAALSQC